MKTELESKTIYVSDDGKKNLIHNQKLKHMKKDS